MKISNTDLVQSYVLTTIKYDFNVVEKRILYRIVDLLQDLTEGKKLNQNYSIQELIDGDRKVTMPISAFLKGEDDKNYEPVKTALKGLRNREIEYEDDAIWEVLGIIEKPTIVKYSSTVQFQLTPRLYEAFLNFSQGFRKFELKVAMEFDSVYSMRFYELFSGVKNPMTYSIDSLKEMFGIVDKYKGRPANFISKVIVPAKKDLDKFSPYSFDYEPLKTGRATTHILFKPYFIPENRDPELEEKEIKKQESLRWIMDVNHRSELKELFGFSEKELKNNQVLLEKAFKHSFYRDVFAKLKADIRKPTVTNPKGLYISELKKMIAKPETNQTSLLDQLPDEG